MRRRPTTSRSRRGRSRDRPSAPGRPSPSSSARAPASTSPSPPTTRPGRPPSWSTGAANLPWPPATAPSCATPSPPCSRSRTTACSRSPPPASRSSPEAGARGLQQLAPCFHETAHRSHQPLAVRLADRQRQRDQATLGDEEALLQEVEMEQLFHPPVRLLSVGGRRDPALQRVYRHDGADARDLHRCPELREQVVERLAEPVASFIEGDARLGREHLVQ